MEGITVPVANVAGLIVLKLLARAPDRPYDEADLSALMEVADVSDLTLAARYARLIHERGYNRDRDLVSTVEGLIGAADNH